jgi:hypothetical protein
VAQRAEAQAVVKAEEKKLGISLSQRDLNDALERARKLAPVEERGSLIDRAMKADYASGVDITNEWKTMTPKERQDAVAAGLHVETDRSGRRIIGNLSQEERTRRLREKVMGLRKELD